MKRHVRYYYNKTVGIKMLLQLAAQITIKNEPQSPFSLRSGMDRRVTVCETKARTGSASDNMAVSKARFYQYIESITTAVT